MANGEWRMRNIGRDEGIAQKVVRDAVTETAYVYTMMPPDFLCANNVAQLRNFDTVFLI